MKRLLPRLLLGIGWLHLRAGGPGVEFDVVNIPNDYHPFSISGNIPEYDFGDAPDTGLGTGPGNYQTRLNDNGPRHLLGGCHLGTAPDPDDDGQPTANADGDDLNSANDEDYGVSFWNSNQLRGNQMGLNLDAHCPPGQLARIHAKAWVDWNQDGVFGENEVIFDQNSGALAQDWSVADHVYTVPADAVIGPTYARVRVSTVPVPDPTGLSLSGEVEDHRIVVLQPGVDLTVNTGADEFDTPSGPQLSLRDLTLQNARGREDAWFETDGEAGGAIFNAGTLTLERCTLRDNAAGRGANRFGHYGRSGGPGGGLFTSGTLHARDCSFLRIAPWWKMTPGRRSMAAEPWLLSSANLPCGTAR